MRKYNVSKIRTKDTQKPGRVFFCLFIAALLILLWDIAGPFGLWKLHRVKEQRRLIYAKVIAASKEREDLIAKITALQNDKKVQEQEVRKRLGWIKDNEILYKFIK